MVKGKEALKEWEFLKSIKVFFRDSEEIDVYLSVDLCVNTSAHVGIESQR